MLKNHVFVFILLLIIAVPCVSAEKEIRDIPLTQVQDAFKQASQPHPRLFLNDQQFPAVLQKIEASDELTLLHKAILEQADYFMDQAPLRRIVTGRRLLSVSRMALKRLLALSWAYRSSSDEKYLKRAEKEMLAIAEFTDWNPPHFLDVAEMSTAMAIGYDWLYNGLSAESRNTIRQAILDKGIHPSLYEDGQPDQWVSCNNNWNQVCHGGMVCGALAVMEDEPELAKTIVHRAVNKVQIAMNEYEPHGAYPEGPGYWVYGTTYNVLMLAALDSVLGSDFGLSQKNGFAKSAAFYLHATGPEGLYFNYPDCGRSGGFVSAVFWMAQKYNDPTLTWNQQQLWKKAIDSGNTRNLTSDSTAVMALIWAIPKAIQPTALRWMGQGVNPVATFRSGWQPGAIYLGIKGGRPGAGHGHMDVGSFVIDAVGYRWALDFGPENYHRIESLGVDLWNGRQDAQRWTLFRYNNLSHNTLVVNGQDQRVNGYAPIIQYFADSRFPHAVIDMTNVYKGQLKKAARGASLLPSGQILIQDELQATDQAATVRWAMATGATVAIQSDTTAVLSQKDKTMRFQVLTDADVKLTTYSTEPRTKYGVKNPNTRMIGFEISLKPDGKVTVAVLMTPSSSSGPDRVDIKELESWSKRLE